MTEAGSEGFEKWGKMAMLLAGALLLALTLGLVFAVTPAKATHTSTCELIDGTRVCSPDVHENTAPTISTSSGSVSAGEGQTAANTGTYSDTDGNSTVALSASVGTVTKDAAGDGTWRWSFGTDDGPAQSQTVTITATDSEGATASTSFSLTVNNLNPAATFNAPQTSYAGKHFFISLTAPSDPSGADRNAGFTYAFDCGGGYGSFTINSAASCQAGSAGTSKTVKGKIRDKDLGVSVEYTRTVTFTAAPPSYPNGRIAFVSRRDGNYEIYTMNANGTGQTRLTGEAADDTQPAFSPDGSQIAFASSRGYLSNVYTDLYAMNADGTNQTRVTDTGAKRDSNPVFSPSGGQIAFGSSRDGNNEIYVWFEKDGSQRRLTNNAADDFDPSWGGAGLPPETTISSGPSGSTNSTSATFEFTSSDPTSIFECKLDSGTFAACDSPKTYSNLSEAEHTFHVRAIGASTSTDSSPASRTWTVDATAPTVTGTTPADLASGVAEGTNATATFSEGMDASTLNSNVTLTKQGSTTPVPATVGYDVATKTATLNSDADLDSRATYTATVKGGSGGAKDLAGNPLAQDRVWSFRTADTAAPPIPAITGGPAEGSTSNSRSAAFAFGSEEGATFLCSLDGAAFSGCASGVGFTGLLDGPHRFEVKARDAAGNESAPAVRRWSVDATGPTVKGWTPTGKRVSPTAKPTVVFSEAMDEASVEASLNGKPTTFFLKKGATAVPASVAYVETTTGQYKAVLVPNKRLRSGAIYTATVTTAAKDEAGNALGVTKSWRFTTR